MFYSHEQHYFIQPGKLKKTVMVITLLQPTPNTIQVSGRSEVDRTSIGTDDGGLSVTLNPLVSVTNKLSSSLKCCLKQSSKNFLNNYTVVSECVMMLEKSYKTSSEDVAWHQASPFPVI